MNDCAFMVGRYPDKYRIPAANDPAKTIFVGGLQTCAIHVKNGHQYPCPYTTLGAVKQCIDYVSAQQSFAADASPDSPLEEHEFNAWDDDPGLY
jgi:hypothetical protein